MNTECKQRSHPASQFSSGRRFRLGAAMNGMPIRLLLAAWLASVALTAPASITIQPWTPMFKGIDFTAGEADTNEVRQQKVFAFGEI